MRIFLGNAPWYHGEFYGVRAGSRWPHFEDPKTSEYMPFPFFLAYAAAVLEQEPTCEEVLLIDGCAEKIDEDAFVARACAFAPDVVVLEVSTASIDTDLRVTREICRRCPGVQIAFCGLHVFMQDEAFFRKHPELTYVFVGEYEEILRDLCRELTRERKGQGKAALGGINGMIWRNASDEIVRNTSRPVIQDLDALPWPARHFLPMYNYHDEPGSIPRPSLQMWASRGCPYKCVFCAWPQIMYGDSHTQYRTRDPHDVVSEIEQQVEAYGFRSVYIDDDTFNIGKKRMMMFASLMKERFNGEFPWAVMARADTSDMETLEAFADAGMKSIKFGVESGDQDIIKKSGKNLKLSRLHKAIEKCHELDVRLHLTFTFGLPGETKETVQKTIDLAQQLNPHSLQFSIVTPFPGSKLYEMMDEEGKLTSKDWTLYDGYHNAVMRTETLTSDDLVDARHRAERIWERYREQRAWEESGQKILSGQSLAQAIRSPRKAARKLYQLLTPTE